MLSLFSSELNGGTSVKRCPDCAEIVQDEARVCRFCRHEFRNVTPTERPHTPTQSKPKYGCFLVIAGIAAVGALSSLGEKSSSDGGAGGNASVADAAIDPKDSSLKADLYADVDRQYAWIEVGKNKIKDTLKDAESAKFQNVHFYSGGGVPVVCGEVNARNSFGGYNGFERFVAAGDQIAALESQVEGGLQPVWSKFCQRSPSDQA